MQKTAAIAEYSYHCSVTNDWHVPHSTQCTAGNAAMILLAATNEEIVRTNMRTTNIKPVSNTIDKTKKNYSRHINLCCKYQLNIAILRI